MKLLNWDTEKSEWLKKERNICFEDIVFFLEDGDILDDVEHPNQEKYPGQRIIVLAIENYVYLVPYIENENEMFLKTIIPSRVATRKYLGMGGNQNELNE